MKLEEITRRDFLKSAGMAATVTTLPTKKAHAKSHWVKFSEPSMGHGAREGWVDVSSMVLEGGGSQGVIAKVWLKFAKEDELTMCTLNINKRTMGMGRVSFPEGWPEPIGNIPPDTMWDNLLDIVKDRVYGKTR